MVTLLPWWPTIEVLNIPKYILLFGPRWWLLIIVIGLFTFWRYLSKLQLQLSPLLILLSLNYLDFQLPVLWEDQNSSQHKMKVVTSNIGEGGKIKQIELLIKLAKPDVILLQEAHRLNMSILVDKSYYSECVASLCIASKYPFERIKVLSRRFFDHWGSFGVLYRLKSEQGDIYLANVHLESVHELLVDIAHGELNVDKVNVVDNNRYIQASVLSMWAKNKEKFIIAGDFNMPDNDNIYQQNFATFSNAINVGAYGVNNTLYTPLHGLRIDHILYSENFGLSSVKVLDSLGGDHRPLMATFNVNN
jgi:endonuclease/exonuclease/phosphatase (EEP) superfamily protein YafD